MREGRHGRSWLWKYALLLILLLTLLCANVCIGTVSISVRDILRSVFGEEISVVSYNILWQLRLPRALAAVVLGGALALSGYLLQTFFHNPIAGPFVLGISSGAKLVVAAVLVLFVGYFGTVSSVALILAAFVGAFGATGFVLLMSRRIPRMSMLIVSGVMIGYICSAVTELIITFAEDSDIVNLHNWSMGSFSGITWENVWVMSAVVLITSSAVFFLSKPIGAYQIGEAHARNLGVNVAGLRRRLVLLSSILSACITAYAGPVSFVGIAVPHLVKRFLGTTRPMLLIPACFLGGSVFCLFCDLVARNLFAPTELSISTVTAIFGAPVVIVIMAERRRGRE